MPSNFKEDGAYTEVTAALQIITPSETQRIWAKRENIVQEQENEIMGSLTIHTLPQK
jgi:hypothetical protein